MSAPVSAVKRLGEFLAQRDTMRGIDQELIVAANHAPLLRSDIESLIEAFNQPCGSCHPCTEYAAETWRRAGGVLPHKYVVDGMGEAIRRVSALADSDLPVSPSELRAALAGTEVPS